MPYAALLFFCTYMLETIKKPFILTIFGASGDLAKIKIFPSLYALAAQKRLPKHFLIVGYARTAMSDAAFKKVVKESIQTYSKNKVSEKILRKLLKHVRYFSGQYDDKESFESYQLFLKEACKDQSVKKASSPHVVYFSVPPIAFPSIVQNLAATRTKKEDDIRLIIEKPFGENEKSAKALFHLIEEHFDESQVYMLDHYLGKTPVQSILNMRRSNRILNNIIRGSKIANIQITASESVGVGHRMSYFDRTGIVKDLVQSHLLQVMALVTMHIPREANTEALQREKAHMIESLACTCDPKDVVIGQYKSYRAHEGSDPKSKTETFAAMRLILDHDDWADVPIYIRTGKKLEKKHTYAVIELKKFPFQKKEESPNRIIIEFYPEPKIRIDLVNFQEDVEQYQSVSTSASIACNILGCLPEHGTLLLDALQKDRIHFLSFDEILASWKVTDEITAHMESGKVRLHKYDDGSEGPKAQHRLTKRDGFTWFDPHN